MIKILISLIFIVLATGFMVNKTKQYNTEEIIEDTSAVVITPDYIKKVPDTAKEDFVKSIISSSKVLDLSGQGLTKTPSFVFDKISIQELNLSNNKIDGSLQAEVRFLKNLKVLNLSNNQFTGVPAEVDQLEQLEVLDLSNNKLTGLPYELGNLSNLKILNLKGNNYTEVDLDVIKQSLLSSTKIQVY